MALGRRLHLAVLLGLLALTACGGGTKQPAAPAATSVTAASGCRAVSPPPGATRTEPKPTTRLQPAKTYDVRLQTNCGAFTIRLAVRTSPATTASFANLVRKGYLDGTVFHRIVPGCVIQGGDPTASGTGGPGYTTVDQPPAATRYTLGLAAMAKTQSEAPGTAGSQFFVVTAKDAGLPPEYAVLGRVVDGLSVVEAIGRLGDPSTQQPTQTVEIEHATLTVR